MVHDQLSLGPLNVDGERRKPEMTHSGRASIPTNLWDQFTVFRRETSGVLREEGGFGKWDQRLFCKNRRTEAKSFTKPLDVEFISLVQNRKLRQAEVSSAMKIPHI